jgi:hypothetical protein
MKKASQAFAGHVLPPAAKNQDAAGPVLRLRKARA